MKKVFLLVGLLMIIGTTLLIWYGSRIPEIDSRGGDCMQVVETTTNPLSGELVSFPTPCSPRPNYYRWKWLKFFRPGYQRLDVIFNFEK